MKNFIYFGRKNNLFRKLEQWLLDDGIVAQMAINRNHLFQQDKVKMADMLILNLDEVGETGYQELIDFPANALLEQIPLLLLAKIPLEKLPQKLRQNPHLDILRKPLQVVLFEKRIQQALRYRQTLQQLTEQKQVLVENTHRNARRIEEVKQQIESAQKEKNALLQEIHHRVKNNLQIVSSILTLNSSDVADPRLEEIIKNTQSRVDTISLIHKNLYESTSLTTIDMQDYLEQQISYLFNHFHGYTRQISLDLQTDPVRLDVDRAIHCALLINELVVNVIRHAFVKQQSSQLIIHLKSSAKNRLELMIADNGIGLPSHIELEQAQSTGLRLIHHLIHQLEGTLELTRDSGTTYRIDFEYA